MLKKIFKLTTVSFLGPFIVTFFVVLFTIVMQFLWKYIDDLVGKGLEWYIIGELLFYATASFVPLAIPLAVLLSSIMSFGKLAETYELVALKSAGVSLFRIMFPLMVLISLISVFSFVFANNVIPQANLKFHSLLWDVRQQRPALDIREDVFYGGIDNYIIRIGKKETESKIRDVTIYDHTSNRGNDVVLTAQRGEMYTTPDNRWLVMKLYDGNRFEEMQGEDKGVRSFPANRMGFESYSMKLDLSVFKLSRTKEELFKDNYQMLNIRQLREYADSFKTVVETKREESVGLGKPYYSFLRDSSIIAGTAFNKKDTLPQTGNFLNIFPDSARHDLALKALNTSRTVSEAIKLQAKEISVWQKMEMGYLLEWHRKFSLAIACLTFFFIGAPLGAIIRKGGIGMPTVVSLILFIVFYIISITAEQSAKEGVIGAFMGSWIANLILFPIGLFLTWQANVDAISFSWDRFTIWFRWMKRKMQRKNEDIAAV